MKLNGYWYDPRPFATFTVAHYMTSARLT